MYFLDSDQGVRLDVGDLLDALLVFGVLQIVVIGLQESGLCL